MLPDVLNSLSEAEPVAQIARYFLASFDSIFHLGEERMYLLVAANLSPITGWTFDTPLPFDKIFHSLILL